jgi:CheY-like chemotaxis protein
VFEPFFTTKDVGKGTGLGLATVYGIVKQSGGYIAIESLPEAGATFRIYLPRVSATRTEGPATRAAAPVSSGSETILLVEDEISFRTLTRELLQANGYRVIEASSGWEALAAVEAHTDPFHLLLTDVVMPHMSGTELAERLRTLRPEIAVLYMSGYTDDALGRHGALTPGTLLLHKPFDERSLTRRVREALDRVAVATV